MGALTIGGSALVIGGSALVIGPRGQEGIMSLQFNIDNAGGTLAGWNTTDTNRTPRVLITAGNVVDSNGDNVADVTLTLVQGGSGRSTNGITGTYPYTIVNGPDSGEELTDANWPIPVLTTGAWFDVGVPVEFRVDGLTPGTYLVKAYAGARDTDTNTRSADMTVTGQAGSTFTGLVRSSTLSPTTSDRVVTGNVIVDSGQDITVLMEQASGSAAGSISGFTLELQDAPEGSPTLTTPYTTIVLDRGTSGSINLATNWTGASTFLIQELPPWMTQSGTTGTVDFTNVQWGGQNSDNTIGSGVWSIQVQAIDSTGLLTTETSIWLYVRR